MIMFNFYMLFSFYDVIVVDWDLFLIVGNMRKLIRFFLIMKEKEVVGLLMLLLDEFLRIERKGLIENLDIYVKDMSE